MLLLCLLLGDRPTISPTILMSNMYQRPDMTTPGGEPDKNMDPKKVQEHFEDFYEDLFEELSKYGEIDSLNVCDNLADHMVSLEESRRLAGARCGGLLSCTTIST